MFLNLAKSIMHISSNSTPEFQTSLILCEIYLQYFMYPAGHDVMTYIKLLQIITNTCYQ